MMKSLLTCVVLLLMVFTSYGQKSVRFTIQLIDLKSKESIAGAHVDMIAQGDTLIKLDNKSRHSFVLVLPDTKDFTAKIVVTHPAFSSKDTTIHISQSRLAKRNDLEVLLEIPLAYSGQYVEGMDVYAQYQPEIVFASEQFSAADFQIDYNGELMVLIYEKRLEKESYVVHFKANRIQRRIKVPFVALRLERDYKGRVVVIGEDENAYVYLSDQTFSLVPIAKKDYNQFVAPIIDTFESRIFYSNYSDWYPAVDYFSVELSGRDTIYNHLVHVRDEEIMALYLAEFKYVDVRTKLWAWDMERETGIDREIWVGANYFTHSLYYESIVAPLFIQGDEVVVADHYKNVLYKNDVYADTLIATVPIQYHQKNGKQKWVRELIQDPITEKIYIRTAYVGKTWLAELDCKTGLTHPSIELFFRYVEKILVYNNEVYYIYRPYETAQKKYIYKEPLNRSK